MSVLAALSILLSHAGMTQGTLAGMIISDQIIGRQNPFTDVSPPHAAASQLHLWDRTILDMEAICCPATITMSVCLFAQH